MAPSLFFLLLYTACHSLANNPPRVNVYQSPFGIGSFLLKKNAFEHSNRRLKFGSDYMKAYTSKGKNESNRYKLGRDHKKFKGRQTKVTNLKKKTALRKGRFSEKGRQIKNCKHAKKSKKCRQKSKEFFKRRKMIVGGGFAEEGVLNYQVAIVDSKFGVSFGKNFYLLCLRQYLVVELSLMKSGF